MDSKSMFSAKTVAALALVGSAATLLPSLSFDLSKRPFTRSASVLSYMPSSILDQSKGRPLESIVFSIQPGGDACEKKLSGNDSGAAPIAYAVAEPTSPRFAAYTP